MHHHDRFLTVFAGALVFCLSVMIVLGAAGNPAAGGGAPQAAPANETRTTPEEFARWMTERNNWGRWGKDDQLGAANLITPAKRKQAAALVKSGVTVSLAHALITEKAVDADDPFVLKPRIKDETMGVAYDRQEIDFHGYTFSHMDALCHVAYKGKLYNNLDFKEVVAVPGGCRKLGILGVKDRMVTRGVLIDIPRLKGLPYLPAGTHIYREEIEAWEKMAGVKAGPGDAILIRTGRWALRAKEGASTRLAGVDASAALYFKDRDVALIGGDGVHDVGAFPEFRMPIHIFAIAALGVNLLDNLDLEQLAEIAAREKRWEFMLMAAPTAVPNGSGSPINPIAVF
jgi:kynurenine formamidase